LTPFMPAKAGIQSVAKDWVPAFAGTSGKRKCRGIVYPPEMCLSVL
jgi:hypothetical protein